MPFPSILGRSMAYGSCTSICWLSPGHLIDYSRLIQPGHILELPPDLMAPDLIQPAPTEITAGLLAISCSTGRLAIQPAPTDHSWPPGHLMDYCRPAFHSWPPGHLIDYSWLLI